jgi:hypothetical protein
MNIMPTMAPTIVRQISARTVSIAACMIVTLSIGNDFWRFAYEALRCFYSVKVAQSERVSTIVLQISENNFKSVLGSGLALNWHSWRGRIANA